IITSIGNVFGQNKGSEPRVLVEAENVSHEQEDLDLFNILQIELKGTYQVQMIRTDRAAVISLSTLELVKNGRLAGEDVYLKLDEFTTIFVPSEQKVNQSGFIPLSLSKYITE
ncbi:MAG: hypothetical protein HRT57_06630, partial [Crocinitomicaceae bacterium]|nr:hypothetical protein [Crocinitomicaceae bacterium]